MTGYLFSHGKAFDTYTRVQLGEILQNLKINMEGTPPFKTITEDTGYVNHGVVKINNVSNDSNAGDGTKKGIETADQGLYQDLRRRLDRDY